MNTQMTLSRIVIALLVVIACAPGSLIAKPDQKAGKNETAKPQPRTLRVAAISVECNPREVDENRKRIEKWMKKAAEADAELALFPEAALSGWWQNRKIRDYGEPVDGPSIQKLIKLARELDLTVAVGMTERDGDKAYITHVLLDGDGVIGKHRKSSLAGGKTNGEGLYWDEGNDANVFTVKDIKLGIAICFESVHPETCRKLAAQGAEIILAPYANGTEPDQLTNIEQGRENGKRTYTYDRAKENMVWYVGCDQTPHNKDRSLRAGAAYIISPTGRLVTITDGKPGEAMVVHTIELPPLPDKKSKASASKESASAAK